MKIGGVEVLRSGTKRIARRCSRPPGPTRIRDGAARRWQRFAAVARVHRRPPAAAYRVLRSPRERVGAGARRMDGASHQRGASSGASRSHRGARRQSAHPRRSHRAGRADGRPARDARAGAAADVAQRRLLGRLGLDVQRIAGGQLRSPRPERTYAGEDAGRPHVRRRQRGYDGEYLVGPITRRRPPYDDHGLLRIGVSVLTPTTGSTSTLSWCSIENVPVAGGRPPDRQVRLPSAS